MLNSQTIKDIEDFVYSKPRSIQEIAEHLGKNWRTADRYVEDIEKNFGTISTRVFREGTRGALKIVYCLLLKKFLILYFRKGSSRKYLQLEKKRTFQHLTYFNMYLIKTEACLLQIKRRYFKRVWQHSFKCKKTNTFFLRQPLFY